MKDFPLIRITLFFIAGIIGQTYLPVSTAFCFILTAILILILIILYYFERKGSALSLTSLILLMLALMTGYTASTIEKSDKNLIPDTVYAVRNFTACGRIDNIDLPNEKGFSFLVKTDSIQASGT
ncbi:MAG TPA: hypothetical protein VI230_08195, partial [Ignavibacteriaceae bacterium]